MLTDTVKPVFCVAKVRLAPMHNAVEEPGFSGVPILHDNMCFVEVVVPKQGGGANEISPEIRRLGVIEDQVELSL